MAKKNNNLPHKHVEPIENRDPEELADMLSDELMVWSGDFIEHNALTKEQREELAAEKRRQRNHPEAYTVNA